MPVGRRVETVREGWRPVQDWIQAPIRDLEVKLAGLQAGTAARLAEISSRTKDLLAGLDDPLLTDELVAAAESEMDEVSAEAKRLGERAVDRTQSQVRGRAAAAALAPLFLVVLALLGAYSALIR